MNFGEIKKICVIGGGEPMVHCARALKEKGVEVSAILAPRHEDSELPLCGEVLGEALRASDIPYVCTDDVNDPAFIAEHLEGASFDTALCFGPAWVFNADVRAAFKDKMVNFNGIPVPRYLGGAHYTWQILNGDKTSGMTIQMITAGLDRGDILIYEETQLPESVRIPQDYFEENYKIACGFLDRFVEALLAGQDFSSTPFADVNPRRLYFPRLLTVPQAFIDWSWNASDIEKFCGAFDQPYPGASSFCKDQRIFLKGVSIDDSDEQFHPFCSGLVVRKHDGKLYLAAEGGLLVITEALDEDGSDAFKKIREGDRFCTPPEILYDAKAYRPQIGSQKPKT